ncbi:MAG: DivIVA domain-containing protein [Actinomycetota bacterium]
MQQELSAEDIESQSFSTGRRGYDKEEVDAYLRALADEIREYHATSAERLYQNLGEEMGALLQHARDSADAMIKQAEEDAAAARHQAEREAHETRAEGQRQADEIRAASEAEAANRIKKADDEVTRLEGVEADARERLSSLRHEIESVVSQLGSLEPAQTGDIRVDDEEAAATKEAVEVRLEESPESSSAGQPVR